MSKRKLLESSFEKQTSIRNCDAFLKWKQEDYQSKTTILDRDNRKELRLIFGEPDGVFQDTFGDKNDVWFKDFEGERFCIRSGNRERGSDYEVKANDANSPKTSQAILKFMDNLYRQLKAHMPTKVLKTLKES